MFGLLSSGVPDTPIVTRVGGSEGAGSGSGGGGGGRGGGRRSVGGGSGNVSGAGSGGGGSGSGSMEAGNRRGVHYTTAESIAVARAWDAATSDPIVGTDQTEVSFWKRVLLAYNDFKPRGARERDAEQLRKKWSRILLATRRFVGIYQNNLLHAESGRSEADVKALSMGQYNTEG
ncbi:GPI-anchored hemophore cfmA-like [Salvia splendens]|uniref:GPI-anchored hemophore cfmA-like n=1 Tax=Salvia splendens TaxID=180675 RepID=UPI001C2521FC|nr:GPI-anchored hemophore cfmA-like [Salvia splendens]